MLVSVTLVADVHHLTVVHACSEISQPDVLLRSSDCQMCVVHSLHFILRFSCCVYVFAMDEVAYIQVHKM